MGTCFFAATILEKVSMAAVIVGATELTLSVLQGLAGRSRVVESNQSKSRKLRTGGVGDPH